MSPRRRREAEFWFYEMSLHMRIEEDRDNKLNTFIKLGEKNMFTLKAKTQSLKPKESEINAMK
jgi:hypothetical protein